MKMNWKKLLVVTLLVGAFSGLSLAPAHADNIPVYIDGKVQTFDQAPIFVNNRMLVPMRAIFEALGAEVHWNSSQPNLVVATKGNVTITLTLGSNTAYKNGQPYTLDVPAQVANNRTLVPIRFVSEMLGADVKWDSVKRTVSITTPPAQDPGQDLTVQQVGALGKSVVMVEMFDQSGQEIASGSGFVISSDGRIITNYHVIEGAASAKIVFPDNTSYTTSTALLEDQNQDLAELKIDATNLTPLTLGDSSQVQLGESVVAIGSPQGLQNTLSTGVVSTVARTDDSGHTYIQISAPIDHGSSGGALFNMQGEVIGVTSYGYKSTANLNLAIPSNVVKQFLQGTEQVTPLSTIKTKESVLKDYLSQNYGTLNNGIHEFHFRFDVVTDKDGVSTNAFAVIEDATEYKNLSDDQVADNRFLLAYLETIIKDMHNHGAVNPYIEIVDDINVSEVVSPYPADEFKPLQDGGYEFIHTVAYAVADDSTSQTKVVLEPDFNELNTTFKLW